MGLQKCDTAAIADAEGHVPTTVRPAQEKVTNFTVLETGAYLYQGLPTTTKWWIDDLAVGKERVGCD